MADVNKSANKFLEDFTKNLMTNTNSCKLAKVVAFYPETYSCDVLPMPSEDNAIIINVPVAATKYSEFLIYAPLKKDDLVLLVFCDNDSDDILLGSDSTQTERKHDISDCFVVGGITLLNEKLNLVDPESLVLQELQQKAYIKIDKEGKIVIEGQDISMKAPHIELVSELIELIGYAEYRNEQIAVNGDPDTDGDNLVIP